MRAFIAVFVLILAVPAIASAQPYGCALCSEPSSPYAAPPPAISPYRSPVYTSPYSNAYGSGGLLTPGTREQLRQNQQLDRQAEWWKQPQQQQRARQPRLGR